MATTPSGKREYVRISDSQRNDLLRKVIVYKVQIKQAAQEIGSLEPSVDDFVSALLLTEMGASGRIFRRESRCVARKIVSEIYSPPRVTKLLRDIKCKHLMVGYGFDLTIVDPDDGLP